MFYTKYLLQNNSSIDFWTIVYISIIILLVLFLHMIFRFYRLYKKKKNQNEPKEPEIKLKKIPTAKYKLMVGGTYIILEENSKNITLGFKVFKDVLRSGNPGLLITRMVPDKVKKKYGLKRLKIIWLSRSDSRNSITPTNLGTIVDEIKEYVLKQPDSIVFLDGLEYLIIQNDFDRVLKFLHSLRDEIAVTNARLIVSLNPKTFTEKKIALLTKELKVLSN